ncbi:serine hydrolase [Patescibacteria group bacterium]|nr:serine hydrolase [Patescibacteria group bacterium]
MRRKTPRYLLPAIVVFAMVYSVSVYVAQQIESLATVVLAPMLRPVTEVPVISAPQFLIFDMNTGAVIVEQNADTIVPIASVTKLFAAATALENYDMQATTSVAWSDLAGDGGAGKLSFGQTYTYRDLLFPLLIESSNDAAEVLARVTDNNLVRDMNSWASTTGATNTTFTDVSGFNDGNVSTAADIKLLLTDTFSNRHHIFDITTLAQYIGPYTGWLNNNPVAGELGYRGGKNGYTVAANRTLAAVFDETIGGHTYTLGYVILGSENIKTDFETLRQFINNSATN